MAEGAALMKAAATAPWSRCVPARPRNSAEGLKAPRNVIPKTLAEARERSTTPFRPTSGNSAAPSRTRLLGDDIAACGTKGNGGRVAVLNALFDEWNDNPKGIAKAKASWRTSARLIGLRERHAPQRSVMPTPKD